MDKSFKPGGEIIVTLKNPERDPATHDKKRQSGIIEPPRRNDYLPRRTSATFINFYTLGQIRDQSNGYIDREIYLNPNEVIADPEILLTLYNFPLTLPRVEWSEKFKKINFAEAEKYRFSVDQGSGNNLPINQSNPNWTEKGLKITSGIRSFTVISEQLNDDKLVFYESTVFGGLFKSIFTGGFQKITNEASYHSPKVDFELSKSANVNVFLNVEIFTSNLIATEYSSGGQQFLGDQKSYPNLNFQATPCGTSSPAKPVWTETMIVTENRSSYRVDLNKLRNWRQSEVISAYVEQANQLKAIEDVINFTLAHYDDAEGLHYLAENFEERFENAYSSPGAATTYLCGNPLPGNGVRVTGTIYDWLFESGTTSGTRNETPFSTLTLNENFSGITARAYPYLTSGMLLGAINQGSNWFYFWS